MRKTSAELATKSSICSCVWDHNVKSRQYNTVRGGNTYILENRKLLAAYKAANKTTQSCRYKYNQAATSKLLSYSIYIMLPFLITSSVITIQTLNGTAPQF